MLPHTGLSWLMKVALQIRIRGPAYGKRKNDDVFRLIDAAIKYLAFLKFK